MGNKNNVKLIDFNNLDKRYSFRMAEDDNQKIVVAQEKGKLILSFVYDKTVDKIVELTGSLGEQMKLNLTEDVQVKRVKEYEQFAFEEYHPNSIKNRQNPPVIKM